MWKYLLLLILICGFINSNSQYIRGGTGKQRGSIQRYQIDKFRKRISGRPVSHPVRRRPCHK